jgi:hypothetical protein
MANKVSTSGPFELQAAAISHIGPVAELRLVPFHETTLSCAEDFSTSDLAGSWGGDAGEMLLALVVAEHSRHQPLTKQQVEGLLRAYVSRSRAAHVYYHTTASAVRWIQQQLSVDELDLVSPPRSLQPRILAALHDSRGQGCSLLRAIIAHPVRFHARLKLVHDFIDAFHNMLWDRAFKLRGKISYHVSRDADSYLGRCTNPLDDSVVAMRSCAPTTPRDAFPYGRFTSVLLQPTPGDASSGTFAAQMQVTSRPLRLADQHQTPPSHTAPALLSVRVSENCMSARHTVLVSANNGIGGAPWLVTHPQLISLRRNATVPMLVSALPGSDGSNMRDQLHEWGQEWALAAEESLGVSQRMDVIFYA